MGASVRARVEQEFVPHALDASEAFEDWGRSYTGAEAFKAGVLGRTWTQLTGEFLEYHHDALGFLGAAAWCDYIPAFLMAVVERLPELDVLPIAVASALTRDRYTDRFDAHITCLSRGQRVAVAQALLGLEEAAASERVRARWTAALDSFWRAQF